MTAALEESFGQPWITDPGVYDLTDAQYHADPVVGRSLSSTGARTLIRATPAHFDWDRKHGRAGKDEFDFGRAAHARVLGVGGEVVVIVGTGKDPNSWRTDADTAAVAAARKAGKTPIRPRDDQVIDAMAAALRKHPTAGPLLARPGRHESVWVWQDAETGVWCRVMADFLPDVPDGGRRIVVDYKTTTDASPDGFAKSMASYGYDQQGDFYTAGVQALDPRDEPPQFVLVAQEKTAPYLVATAYLSPLALARGHHRNRRALALYRDCTATGTWPGYPTEPIELQLPAWAAREFEAEAEAEELTRSYFTFGEPAA